jgi:unsaturated rhamnogalacturonyl hydrolase
MGWFRWLASGVVLLAIQFPGLASDAPAPRSWAVATADSIIRRNPGTPQDRLARWSYVTGYTLNGIEMVARYTGERKYWDFIKRVIDPFIDEKGHLQGVHLTSLDNVMAGNIVVGLYEHTHDPRYRIAAGEIRQAFSTFPRNSDGGFWHSRNLPGEMWIDGIFMGAMPLIRYGHSIGDAEYCFDEVTKQITTFARHAQKDDSGLYYHAWAERPELPVVIGHDRPSAPTHWADPKTGLSSEVWSEGLGWYALVLAEALSVLPKDHPRRAEVLDIYLRLAARLKRTQDSKSGRWFQVVDKGDRPDNWTDNSGSAMFTYSIQRGIDLHLLDSKVYSPVVSKGYRGLIENARLNEYSLVDIVSACEGLCVQASYADYVHYPRAVNANEAVAGFLWATAIVEKPAAAADKDNNR